MPNMHWFVIVMDWTCLVDVLYSSQLVLLFVFFLLLLVCDVNQAESEISNDKLLELNFQIIFTLRT